MRRAILALCITCISFLAARADQPFVEFDGHNGFWASGGFPPDAFKSLKDAQKDEPKAAFKCFAFTPAGDWVFLFDHHAYGTSNVDLPVCKRLAQLQKDNAEIECVAFAPTGGWTVLWKETGNWTEGNVPDAAFKKLQQVIKDGQSPRGIAFGPHESWVILFGKTGVYYSGVPGDLAKVLGDCVHNGTTVRCVCFTGNDWICLTSNGWWTSNLELPASKFIASNIQSGHSPKWVCVKPGYGKHDFAKWSQIIHNTLDGKIAAGYAFEVRDKGKIVAKGAEGWVRTPWEKEDPSIPWTLDKPMGVASVSKTVTAVAILKLWEESGGSFSLDDPFWPHIKAVCPTAHADVKHVTIRQLLMHTSGFKKGDDCTTPDALEKLLNEPLAHKPGTFGEYENNNFYILHLVLEQIGHTQYTPYVKEHVLKPTGITHMETHFQARQPMCGYGKPGDQRPGFPYDWQCEAWAGAAGWYASVSDLSRFLQGLRENKVLNPDTTAMMFKQNLGVDGSDPGWVKNGGWLWDEGSGGRAGNLHSAIAHFPDDIDAVILSNSDSTPDVDALVIKAWEESQ